MAIRGGLDFITNLLFGAKKGYSGGITPARSSTVPQADWDKSREMLEQDLLVRIVEQTEGTDQYDVMMRRLSFNELVRREQLGAADSRALKVYAVNRANLYGKDIQCQAMRELAERTGIRV